MILSIITGVILGLIITSTLVYSTLYFCETDLYLQKIKFKDFINLYNFQPGKWKLHDINNHLFFYGTCVDFRFGVLDYLKYRVWKYRKEKKERDLKHCEEMKKMLDYIKKDIRQTSKNNKARIESVRANIRVIDGNDRKIESMIMKNSKEFGFYYEIIAGNFKFALPVEQINVFQNLFRSTSIRQNTDYFISWVIGEKIKAIYKEGKGLYLEKERESPIMIHTGVPQIHKTQCFVPEKYIIAM